MLMDPSIFEAHEHMFDKIKLHPGTLWGKRFILQMELPIGLTQAQIGLHSGRNTRMGIL